MAYAQLFDFDNAYKNFLRAYHLNPGNKLFAVMSLISADRVGIKVREAAYMKSTIFSKSGLYNYFGQALYVLFIDQKMKITDKKVSKKMKKTIFYKAIVAMQRMKKKRLKEQIPLIQENIKDPMVYLLNIALRKKGESDYEYYSKLQDKVPLSHNDNFLIGPPIVTEYYIDILKTTGLLNKANLKLHQSNAPTYLRTKVLRFLYRNQPDEAIKTLEYLQERYKLQDRKSYYLLVAAYLQAKKYSDAGIANHAY